MEGVLAHHADDIVMFDVPPPAQLKGIDAYRESWERFFATRARAERSTWASWRSRRRRVAFCHAILTCGSADPADQFPVRLTVGLRKVDGDWLVTHEHHSVPAG